MVRAAQIADLGAPVPDSDDVAPATPRRGEILLIEDCTEVREGLAQLLELHGYMVTEFADGERGMRELATQPQAFALVILDLMLGESMAGMEFSSCRAAARARFCKSQKYWPSSLISSSA